MKMIFSIIHFIDIINKSFLTQAELIIGVVDLNLSSYLAVIKIDKWVEY